jgi:hydrogenase assembly chaperone HypC/HupF
VCLGEVVQVVAMLPDRQVETGGAPGGRSTRVSLLALEGPVAVGDWLLVHSGFALERLTDAEARAALTLRAGDADGAPIPPTDDPLPPDTPTGDPT